MFPLIINYSPKKRAINVPLDQHILIEFDDYIRGDNFPNRQDDDYSTTKDIGYQRATIKLYNVNTDTELGVNVRHVSEQLPPGLTDVDIKPTKGIEIVPLSPLENLVQYKVVVSDIYSILNKRMTGKLELTFTTVAGKIDPDLRPDDPDQPIYIVKSSPKDNGVMKTDKIKIQLSEDIVPGYIPEFVLYEGPKEEDFEFSEAINILEGIIPEYSGDILSLEIPGLESLKRYTLEVRVPLTELFPEEPIPEEDLDPEEEDTDPDEEPEVLLPQLAPEGLEGFPVLTFGGTEGKITGTTTEMEFRPVIQGSWSPAVGTIIDGLQAGAYLVRYAAKLGYKESPSVTIVVKASPRKYEDVGYITFTKVEESIHTSVDDVLSSKAVGSITEGMSEQDIQRIIGENTKLAEYLIEKSGSSISITEKSMVTSEYIKYKTQYDIVFDRFIELSANPTAKKLKDLEIKYGWALKDILALLNNLKGKYLEWELALQEKASEFARAGVFIPGEDVDEMPDFKNRQLRDIEGAKSW